MTEARRAVVGFLLAPLIVGVAIAGIVFVAGAAGEPAGLGRALSSAVLALGFAVAIGWTLAFLLGVPAFLMLKRLRVVSPWPTILVAALIGATVPWLLHWSLLDPSTSTSINGCDTVLNGVTTACGYRHLAQGSILPALIGAAAGLVFWLVYAGGWRLRTPQDGGASGPSPAPERAQRQWQSSRGRRD